MVKRKHQFYFNWKKVNNEVNEYTAQRTSEENEFFFIWNLITEMMNKYGLP